MRARNRRIRARFTLVELLMVMAIVSILMAMLLPTAKSGLETARLVACQNNLRQLYSACVQYGNENRGIIPPYKVVDGTYWYNLMLDYTNCDPRITKSTIWDCPTNNRSVRFNPTFSGGFIRHYTIHGAVSGRPMGKYATPSRVVLFTEMRLGEMTPTGWSLYEFANSNQPPIPFCANNPGYHGHKFGANFAFLDGHTEWRGKNPTKAEWGGE